MMIIQTMFYQYFGDNTHERRNLEYRFGELQQSRLAPILLKR
jgi:hypothetical protein